MKLDIKSVSKVFPSVRALDEVSLEFRPGEIHALMGENGAGKSTLIKIILACTGPMLGRSSSTANPSLSPRRVMHYGRHLAPCTRSAISSPRFSVGENIMLEDPPLRRGFIDYATIYQRASELLAVLDPGIDVRAEVSGLSVAQMQLVEIAKALSLNARVLLLDEPTASITDHEAAALFTRAAPAQGRWRRHRLRQSQAGRGDGDLRPRDRAARRQDRCLGRADRPDVAAASRLADDRPRRAHRRNPARLEARPVALELKNALDLLRHTGHHLTLRKAEILGLYGLVGAGRTELARALVGAGAVTGGQVLVRGEPAVIHNPHDALKRTASVTSARIARPRG